MDKLGLGAVVAAQVELETAVSNFRHALAKASVCGYIHTVKEDRERYVAEKWKKYAKRHTTYRIKRGVTL